VRIWKCFFNVLGALLFVCANAARCRDDRFVGVLDCSSLSLKTAHALTNKRMYWVIVVNLRGNDIVHVNDTELLYRFPNVRVVDLRGNQNLQCRLVWKSRISTRSNCKFVSFVTAFTQIDIYQGLCSLTFFLKQVCWT
jgi:hypothetical protein